ncbi:MAG: hypothetical protein NCW75_03305 [Phycisphaera sp.]|nr:MAG: hypothetical protein NCW75_03305 [Phycisphaera sp.]
MTQNTPDNTAHIPLYGPKATGIGIAASIVASAFGAGLALAAGAEGDSLMGGVVAAGLLTGSWVLAWGAATLTGPYRVTTAGMAWLALSTIRLMVLIVSGIALAFAAPTMGLGLWFAMLAGGLTAVAVDCGMALKSFREHQTVPVDLASVDPASVDRTSGGTR